MRRNQLVNRFQLATFWSTSLRCREYKPSRQLRLGEPSEGCRAEAHRGKAGRLPRATLTGQTSFFSLFRSDNSDKTGFLLRHRLSVVRRILKGLS